MSLIVRRLRGGLRVLLGLRRVLRLRLRHVLLWLRHVLLLRLRHVLLRLCGVVLLRLRCIVRLRGGLRLSRVMRLSGRLRLSNMLRLRHVLGLCGVLRCRVLHRASRLLLLDVRGLRLRSLYVRRLRMRRLRVRRLRVRRRLHVRHFSLVLRGRRRRVADDMGLRSLLILRTQGGVVGRLAVCRKGLRDGRPLLTEA